MATLLPIEQRALFADNADAPAAKVCARAKSGDMWGLGNHLLLVGDATSPADVGRLLDAAPEPPRLLITDPPYGVGYESHRATGRGYLREQSGLDKRWWRRQGAIVNDDRANWADAFGLCPAPIAYIFHAALNARVAMDGVEGGGYQIRQQIIWVKDNIAIGWAAWQWQHECAVYAVRESELGGGGVGWIGGRAQSSVWQIRGVQSQGAPTYDYDGSEHPTQKPVECFAKPLRSHKADVVIDMFAGSGTVFIAAERIGRTALGIEIAPQYADMAIARYEGYTGNAATLIERRLDNAAQAG